MYFPQTLRSGEQPCPEARGKRRRLGGRAPQVLRVVAARHRRVQEQEEEGGRDPVQLPHQVPGLRHPAYTVARYNN